MLRKPLFLLLALASLAWSGVVPGRYVVELEDEAGRPADRLVQVRARQTTARQKVASLRGARVVASIERVGNSLLVEAPDATAAAALAALPGVKRVHAVRTVKLHLDRAIALQKIDEAWRQVGEDRAGAGIKVAVIDSGVDIEHPGLAPNGLTMPAGFPRVNRPEDEANTSAKVIVARSYVDMLPTLDPDRSARDRVGHGTALAMIIAGGRATAPLATIAGVAPRAQIGSYKVFGSPNFNDEAPDDVILKAIDDAVADGMDIINLSLGSDVAPRLEDDIMAQAVERAVKAGVIVITSAGNNGPEFGTIGSPATAPSAIAVGATRNGRVFGTSAAVDGLFPFVSVNGDGPAPTAPVVAPGFDLGRVDQTRLACQPLPAESLRGRVAVILRGDCTFNTKLTNALAAGAVAAVIYTQPTNPLSGMITDGAQLPAMMISAADGEALRARLAASADAQMTLNFRTSAIEQESNRLVDFSSIGPSPTLALKPELAAIGGGVYTATQRLDRNGDMYNASGFILVSGTSFSAPMVAGAAALLKAARPGLTVEQYRSLLINTATASKNVTGSEPAIAQQAGAGQLDLAAALRTTLAVAPATLSFGAGTADPRAKATLRLSNLSSTAESYSFQLVPRGDSAGPALPASATVAGGGSVTVELPLEATALRAGAHEGRLRIIAASGAQVEVPYWYAVTGDVSLFPILILNPSGRRGALVRDAIVFRAVDSAGVPVAAARPEVTVRQGDATATLTNYDNDSPGLWGIDLRLGLVPGPNIVRLQVGDKFRDVVITAN